MGDANDITFDLIELSMKANQANINIYIEYIAVCIEMYGHFCLSRNLSAMKEVKEKGLGHEHIEQCLIEKALHERLRTAYIFLARCVYVDNDPYPLISASKI